jgi:outer membrane immunogenic protein
MAGKILRGMASVMAGTCAIAMFAASPAYSADLGSKSLGGETVPMPAAVPIKISASWTGLSLGGHLGGATGGDEDVVGGVHLGYSRQDGQVVYGIEGDVSFGEETFGSIRGRLGFAGGRSWLLYGTAGVAISNNDEGLVAGGGLEYRVTGNTSIGAEALYYDLDEDFTVIRGRVTWHFGGTSY